MIARWRKRFVEEGLELALKGKPQTKFRAKKIDGRVEAKLVVLRCSDTPAGSQKWSFRLVAETWVANGEIDTISHESVRQGLKKTKLNRGKCKSCGYSIHQF